MSLPRLRAPRDDGDILAEPPLAQTGGLLARNRHELSAANLEVLGKPLVWLRNLARSNAWSAASRYLAERDEPCPALATTEQFWLLAGHQPELFHPGVWVKNFAMQGLARRHGGLALNLIVDNDAARPPLLHLPAGAHVASVPFDHWQGDFTYEERPVLDEALFASLPQRAAPLCAAWPFEPLLPVFWRESIRRSESTPLLGERLASARRALQRQWGCLQAEVPLSRLCQTEAFAWFGCHLLLNAQRLRADYNTAVHDYRRRYRLRNMYHPVPDLAQEDEWCELPLWAWRTGGGRRGRLFVRPVGNELRLRAGGDLWPALVPGGAPERLVGQWLDLGARGYKIRTRALTTTLFARLLLADLFIHGIGGGKYDELTDDLIARFFGLPVPRVLILSATLLLPLPRYPISPDSCRELARAHRDLWYNPQRHFSDRVPPAARELMRNKEEWIRRGCATRAERRERFQRLREINESLRPFLEADERRLRDERDQCLAHLRVNEVAGRRDYPFCLYPEAMLREFYQRFLTEADQPPTT